MKVKAFVGHHVMVPHDWARAVGKPHHAQADILAYAESKAALIEHLSTLTGGAEGIARALTLPSARSSVQYGNHAEAIMAAFHPADTGPAVFVYNGQGAVVRVEAGGALTVVGSVVTMPVFIPE